MNVGVIGDTHIPFEHPNYLSFCKKTFKKHKCSLIVHIGDLVDNHSISYHEHDPDLLSPKEEWLLTRQKLRDWFKAFPKVKLCSGNHDELPSRKGKTIGLPSYMIRDFKEIYNLPKKWEYQRSYQIEGVKYFHGVGYGGKMAHKNAAIGEMQSVVIGHHHSIAGCEWIANENMLIFGLSTGCGVDKNAKAFSYGNKYPRKPILGCGIVINGGEDAKFIPMPL